MKHPIFKKILIALLILTGLFLLAVYPAYRIGKHYFNAYFDEWGDRLVDLEKRDLLSKEYGAAWQDILESDEMASTAQQVIQQQKDGSESEELKIVDGIAVENYPSLSIIRRLNEINEYSNTISIIDRNDLQIAEIRTDHARAQIEEFPQTLLTALIAAEDGNFYENSLGFEFDSFVRAGLRALWEAVTTFSWRTPRGTSTITQQVAKLFISDIDEHGHRIVNKDVDRKVREMRLAAALRKMYSADEILEVYVNHCVTSDYGLIGFKDISRGLFSTELAKLSDAQCLYMARMVKWGRNLPGRITRQCRIDMPRMGAALGWDEAKRNNVLSQIDSLEFHRPNRINTDYGALVDLANEFWLRTLKRNGFEKHDLTDMDIIDPNSLIRKKGNLTIKLAIDLALQQELQRLVDARGYGKDTTILTDVRIGSKGEDIASRRKPRDRIRKISIIQDSSVFSEPESEFSVTLAPGDTLITNIRHRRLGTGRYRRSYFYYTRKPANVDGQYYAYAIIDSKTGKLLAYYARDRIGSRLASLLDYRTPNGSSTAKPIFNALNFDLGIFKPYEKWDDRQAVIADVPWKRKLDYRGKKPVGVIFANSAVRGRGYKMANHGDIFEGCLHIFDQLAVSNNILGVETVYRLNRQLFDRQGEIQKAALPLVHFFNRIGAFGRIKKDLNLNYVTGVRVYKELARIIGVDIDTMAAYGKRVPISDSLYSVGLGTLELTLWEQVHLFNVLYNNDLIENPAQHPSLVIESISLNQAAVEVNDTIKHYHPFSNINNLRPTYLGMFKRLTSNKWDKLEDYDIAHTTDFVWGEPTDTVFNYEKYYLEEPPANYAKSGTTDDIIRPFNADATSRKRTNYGMWNAVVRIDLSKLGSTKSPPAVKDLTVACIGECNYRYTGARDGKSLHKFITKSLLHKAGQKSPDGYYHQYEKYLERVTPDSQKTCGSAEPQATSPEKAKKPSNAQAN
ncbi:MAG: hypothetical protein GF398_08120 [Chitinivibrionales bacterium]|nr:hypothetical protein [Chitinivibrionales bacterium]